MKFPWQKTTWENSIKANVALSISNLILAIVVGSIYIHSTSVKSELVIMPPVIDEKMIVGWDSANEAYIKSFALYTTTLIANITSANAQFVADAASQFLDSGIYPSVRSAILAAAETKAFKEAAASTKFEPIATLYEPASNKVFVMGKLVTLSAVTAPVVNEVTYEMKIRIVERRPVVFSLESYQGNTPHTLEWIANQPTPTTPAVNPASEAAK